MYINELKDLANLLDFVASRPNMANLVNIEEVGREFSRPCNILNITGDEPTDAQKAQAWEIYQAAISNYLVIKDRLDMANRYIVND